MVKKPQRITRRDDERATLRQRPTKAVAADVPKATTSMLYIGPGFVGGTAANAEIERQLHYAISELGGVLVKDTSGVTYEIKSANGGASIQAAGASLATVRTLGRAVDPGIP